MSFNYGKDITEEQIHARQAIVFGEQDRWIVESQRPHSMLLNIEDEMHVTSDRLGIAYRRWIKQLGEKNRDRPIGIQKSSKSRERVLSI